MNNFFKLAKLYHTSMKGQPVNEFAKAVKYFSNMSKTAGKSDIDGAWYKDLDSIPPETLDDEEVNVYDLDDDMIDIKPVSRSVISDDDNDEAAISEFSDNEYAEKSKEDLQDEIQTKEEARQNIANQLRANYSKETRLKYIKVSNELNRLYDQLGKMSDSESDGDELPTSSIVKVDNEDANDNDFEDKDTEPTLSAITNDDFVPEMQLSKEEFDNNELNEEEDEGDDDDDD